MFKRTLILVMALALAMPLFAVSAQGGEGFDPPPGFDSWEQVLEEANGQTVNWYMWGGSDSINNYVDTFYGEALQEYGVTLNRVPANAVDFVNLVLSEDEAGVGEDEGSVDLMWINGENFYTLYQADLLYGPFAVNMPNSRLVDHDATALDFGRPTEVYESVWSGAQFQLVYDTARMSEEDLPRSYAELTEWLKENPGRFTYMAPGPGAFQGTRFVKQIFYELAGGYEPWLGAFNQELYDEYAPQVWELLNEWEPYLWREGETYPAEVSEMHELFANFEIDFSLTQAIAGAQPAIDSGQIPPTSKAFVFDANFIGDFNYVAIPAAASNKAAALVLANLILRPDMQAAQVQPQNGFGLGFGIDVSRVEDEEALSILDAALANLGDGAADPADLAAALAPDIVAEYQALIEADWEANVLRQ